VRGIAEVTREAEEDGGEGGGDPGERVVEHRHLDEERLDALGLPDRELERDVGAQRGAAHDGGGQLEVLDQRRHLTGEERHRVEAQVLGAVGAPVAEQVDADHPVPAPRHRRPQPLEHAAVHQQAVDEDQHALAVPVGVVLDPVTLVAELAHAASVPC
jgi:hypothetical protein